MRLPGGFLLARDRIGVKPLYYAQTAAGLFFASEIKALLTSPEVSRTLDLEAAGQFFRLGFVPPPRTLLRDVRKLPPGWRLIAEGEHVQIEAYWDLEFVEPDRRPSFERRFRGASWITPGSSDGSNGERCPAGCILERRC